MGVSDPLVPMARKRAVIPDTHAEARLTRES
jgi:hypothetical protein